MKKRQIKGFILPTVLMLLAIMVLAATFLVSITEKQREQVLTEQKLLNARIEMQNTKAILLYRLASHPFNASGLAPQGRPETLGAMDIPLISGKEIRVDDFPYQGWGKTQFSIQDTSGLLGINLVTIDRMKHILGFMDVEFSQRDQLVDSLLDYKDVDTLTRLNGAEKEDYLRLDLLPPPNRPLHLPQELQYVMGWSESGLLNNEKFRDIITVFYGAGINLNTSPQLLLEATPGISKTTAKHLVNTRPHMSLSAASQKVGMPLPLDELETGLYAGSAFRIRIYHPDYPAMQEYLVELTPGRTSVTPWTIEYALEYPFSREDFTWAAQETGLEEFSSKDMVSEQQ